MKFNIQWTSSVILLAALIGFEVFNFASTEFSLADLTGGIEFMGVRWATLIALAFCGTDFAGVARIFTPERGDEEPKEVLFLFGGWLMAAMFNAVLSWWGILQAMLQKGVPGNEMVPHQFLVQWFPIFAALLVLLTRFLLVGTLVTAFEGGGAKKPKAKVEAKPEVKVHDRPKPALPGPNHPTPAPQFSFSGRSKDRSNKKGNNEPGRLFGDLIKE